MIGDIDYLSLDKHEPIIISKNNKGDFFKKKDIKDTFSVGNPLSKEEIREILKKQFPHIDSEKILKSIEEFNSYDLINKEVKLYYHKEINRIIISIIDKETKEVLSEIPCKELQNLAKYLKEELGNLYDEKV